MVLKEDESEDLQTGQLSPVYDRELRKKAQNYMDVKTLTVDLFNKREPS